MEQEPEVQPEQPVEPSASPPGPDTAVVTTPAAMIEAHGLSKYYGPFVAVQDASFSIPEGQIVAFLGPNGAGKTTLMRMLTGARTRRSLIPSRRSGKRRNFMGL